MRHRDVKVGEEYYHYMGRVTAEEILERDPSQKIWEPMVLCRFHKSHETRRSPARYLTPWADHQAEQAMMQAQAEEIVAGLQKIADVIGKGAEVDPRVNQRYAMLKLTEPAAERVLELCEAKPLPENRRPSKASTQRDKIKLSKLLGQRVRRALGMGYSGGWMASYLYRETDNPKHLAMLYIYPGQMEAALKKLGGTPEQESSALADLI